MLFVFGDWVQTIWASRYIYLQCPFKNLKVHYLPVFPSKGNLTENTPLHNFSDNP